MNTTVLAADDAQDVRRALKHLLAEPLSFLLTAKFFAKTLSAKERKGRQYGYKKRDVIKGVGCLVYVIHY
jgi:hypothetical protein